MERRHDRSPARIPDRPVHPPEDLRATNSQPAELPLLEGRLEAADPHDDRLGGIDGRPAAQRPMATWGPIRQAIRLIVHPPIRLSCLAQSARPGRRRERGRSRRPGKSDPGDAFAIARVTLREPDLPPVRLEDRSTELGLLADARDDLVHAQTRARNRLHAHLVVLMPGYGRTTAQLVSGRQLETIERVLGGSTGVRAEPARALLTEVRDLGRRAGELERSIAALVAGHPLLELPGVGILTAARLVAEVGDVARFRSPAAFAMLAGVAPIPASSGETQRMRLNRGGNRRLNRALYTIALSQAWHHEPAKAYIARKRAAGKSWAEALRCLKHRVSRPVFRLLQAGQLEWARAA